LRAATQGKVGLLGSYCWHGSGPAICADYPAFTERESELPQITQTTATDHMVFLLDGGYPFASWSASYIDSSGARVPLASGGGSFDPDAANQSITPTVSAAFPPPPDSGAWIVQVQVRFIEGGDAAYGWKVTVP
jgi:hypothetical protein